MKIKKIVITGLLLICSYQEANAMYKGAFERLEDEVEEVHTAIVDSFSDAGTWLSDAATSATDSLMQAGRAVGDAAYEIVSELERKFYNGIHTSDVKGHDIIAWFNVPRVDEIPLLLQKGYVVDLNIRDMFGHTALLSIISGGDYDMVKLLVDAGADVNIPNASGWTPLMDAAISGHVDIVKLLLDHGADVHAVYRTNQTVLTQCANRMFSDDTWNQVLPLLINAGANLPDPALIKNYERRTQVIEMIEALNNQYFLK